MKACLGQFRSMMERLEENEKCNEGGADGLLDTG